MSDRSISNPASAENGHRPAQTSEAGKVRLTEAQRVALQGLADGRRHIDGRSVQTLLNLRLIEFDPRLINGGYRITAAGRSALVHDAEERG